MQSGIQVIRSRRKSLCIQVNKEGAVIVRAPYRLSEKRIRDFLVEKQDWIEKQIRKAANVRQEAVETLTMQELQQLKKRAKELIAGRVAYYAEQVGVSYGNITIRAQRTLWGSCSRQGNLNFNCLLLLAPQEVLDYVVVHELCHRREMNHSERFWNEVERVLPDYRERRKWLKDHGAALLAGLEG